MALRKFLILRKPPTGPRVARPEDRLRGCLEERTVPIQPIRDFFTGSFAGATIRSTQFFVGAAGGCGSDEALITTGAPFWTLT